MHMRVSSVSLPYLQNKLPSLIISAILAQYSSLCDHLVLQFNAPVPLRPAVLRFIPEPPGHPGSWTGVNRVKMTFFCRKISTVDRRGPQRPGSTPGHPGAPRFIQVEPRQGHGSSRRLHGSPRFSSRFSTVHPGPCRQNPGDATVLPGSPRRSYGPSRFIPAR